MKIDGLKFTVRVPYVGQIDVPYKHSEKFDHLRQYGSRYGDRFAELSFSRYGLVRKNESGEIEETVEVVEIDGKVIPIGVLAQIMETLSTVRGPTYELISNEKASEIREGLERSDAKAAEAAKANEPS